MRDPSRILGSSGFRDTVFTHNPNSNVGILSKYIFISQKRPPCGVVGFMVDMAKIILFFANSGRSFFSPERRNPSMGVAHLSDNKDDRGREVSEDRISVAEVDQPGIEVGAVGADIAALEAANCNNGVAIAKETNNGIPTPGILSLHKPNVAHRGRVKIGAGIYLLSVWMSGAWDQLPEIDRPAQAQRFDDEAGWFLLELVEELPESSSGE
jgi:hypothetical protein